MTSSTSTMRMAQVLKRCENSMITRYGVYSEKIETEEFVQLVLGAAQQCGPAKEMNDTWSCLDLDGNGDTYPAA